MPIGLMQELLGLLKGAVAIAGVVGLMGMYIPQVTIHHQTNALKKIFARLTTRRCLLQLCS